MKNLSHTPPPPSHLLLLDFKYIENLHERGHVSYIFTDKLTDLPPKHVCMQISCRASSIAFNGH